MLWIIIKKELLQMIQTQKFIISIIILFILMLLSLHVSSTQYREKLFDYQRATTLQQNAVNEINSLTELNVSYTQLTSFDHAVFRKPTPLSIICHGME